MLTQPSPRTLGTNGLPATSSTAWTMRRSSRFARYWTTLTGSKNTFDPGFYLMVSDRLDVSMDPQEVVDGRSASDLSSYREPEYSYNTVGHIVAGLVIEAVTGKTAHETMRELVFDPAGVTELYLTPGESPPTYVPAMYVQGELAGLISLLPGLAPYLDAAEVGDLFDLSVGPQEVLTSAPWTGGGIEAQMDDLARFFKAMFDGTVLQEETVELFSETALDTSYALGIQLSERVGYRTFEHGGGVPGFRSTPGTSLISMYP